jgi:hypothetical protein
MPRKWLAAIPNRMSVFTAVPCAGAGVPVSVLAASPQRYVRARKRRHTHVPRRSTIVRLRSGAAVSRAGAFRIGPFRKGAMRRALARLRSRVRFGRRSARRLGATSLRSCARLLRNLRGFPPKASLSSAHSRATAFLRDAPCIRRYGALGLVGIPPCANRLRPGGACRIPAADCALAPLLPCARSTR